MSGDRLETERLELRELDLDDAPFVQSLLDDDAVMRFYPDSVRQRGGRGWVDNQRARYERDGHGLWLASLRHSGEPVGMIGLCMQLVEDEVHPEIGYIVASAHWRRGIASEAALACRARAFDVYDYPYVISLVRPINTPSAGVARKIGMQIVRRAIFSGLEHDVFRVDR
ncbi:MAG: GNAT family N-acetyltransferase [Myxococcales bacterium]|nr:GNAT family N-acetyltransferase [Myxococcales bacterium]